MSFKNIEDLIHLEKLDEDEIVTVLRSRYARDKIYTNCGEILIAVNPYKTINIYDSSIHEQYDWKKFESNAPPHIFNVAARAYQRMRESTTNQVILVSGESGAGKTESTKLMVKHFVHMCPHGNEDLHQRIIKVNPLLEAFGNAQTIMNTNSSRFAKFLELQFAESGQILGAVVRDYMLEKSRVVTCSSDEGNFHIFYSLFAGCPKKLLSQLSLTAAEDYRILKSGNPGLLKESGRYRQMYAEQMSVLRDINFGDEDIDVLQCMLGAILHLTEIRFREPDQQNEPLEIVNLGTVHTAAELLNVNPIDLCTALLKTKTEYGAKGGEEIYCLKSLDQAENGRDALSKAIYERLFGWIIRQINEDLNPSKQRGTVAAAIGILDIAGFENLQYNSFEQMCINFVNERLQNFTNDLVLKTESAIYREEGIDCEHFDFTNNDCMIEIFTKKAVGILNLLDEETRFQQGNDNNFVNRVTDNHSTSGLVVKGRSNAPEFGINHFAGKVCYRCEDILEKNKDTLNEDFIDCMKSSENPFIQDLFTVTKGPTGTISETQFMLRQSRKPSMLNSKTKPKYADEKALAGDLASSMKQFTFRKVDLKSYSNNRHKTVVSYFKESMNKLLEKLNQAEAHFVRCLKPNRQKQEDNFNVQFIKEQLLYNGITEVAKIRQQGFPVRKLHLDFYKRYCVLRTADEFKSPGQNARDLMEKVLPDHLKTEYKIGTHKVFLKEEVYLFLEKELYRYLEKKQKEKEIRDKELLDQQKREKSKQKEMERQLAAKKHETVTVDCKSNEDTNKETNCYTEEAHVKRRIENQRLESNPSNSVQNDYGHKKDSKVVGDANLDEDSSKKKEPKPFWDIFSHIPRERKTRDVHERSSLRGIKLLTYAFLFLVILISLVLQKISLVLLVNTKQKDDDDARIFLLMIAMCIPYVLIVIVGILKVLFGSFKSLCKKTIIIVIIMECAHSVGLGFLVFTYLGQIHAATAIMLMSTTCILPSLLRLFSKNEQTVGRSICKTMVKNGFGVCAIFVQLSGVMFIAVNTFLVRNNSCTILHYNNTTVINSTVNDESYQLETAGQLETALKVSFALILCSFSWWENFIETPTIHSKRTCTGCKSLQQLLLAVKFDLQECRPKITTLSASCKILVTVIMAWLVGELDFSEAAEKLSNSKTLLNYTSIFCITICSFIAYYIAYTACKLKLQVPSYSLACALATPVAVGIVVLDCTTYSILSPFTNEKFICCNNGYFNTSDWYLYVWGFFGLLSFYWIAGHIWFPNQERLAKVERLFVNPFYCSILLEQHLVMNRRRSNSRIRKDVKENGREFFRIAEEELKSSLKKIPPMIYACATMWHENRQEMVQLLKSLYRVDKDQHLRQKAVEIYMSKHEDEPVNTEEFEYYEFEAHILFDDAFELNENEETVPNKFVRMFTEVMQEAANSIHNKDIKLRPPRIIPSPYGAQIVYLLPGNNFMYIHLKDKNKIRHRKRWSQVMYMYYLLGYRIGKESEERIKQYLKEEKFDEHITWDTKKRDGKFGKSQIFNFLDDEVLYRAENTFILALDGDVDFTPKAVRLLIDRMVKNEELGAACGRIHPIGKGPMVWYQKFEYAVAHWLQKSTEHVLGCVLCSPGCFSLFRGSALMDDNVMRKYTIKPTEASHHLMYDQGEDRWLCTLLLQQGYRVDYAAASDAYTYAPEGFGEFFNQRRRWMPSTIANIMDLLTDAKNTVSINNNISWLYMIYQGALMVSTLIGPATVIMMIAGAFLTVFKLDLLTSYAIALLPAIVYTILCFVVKPKYQILCAEIFSAVYSFIMMVVFVGCIITAVQESPFHPSVIFLCSMVFIFLFAAVIHPWEFSCIIYGVLYFLCVPSGFLLLVIYSLCNLNSVSWGTREVAKKKTKKEIEEEEKKKAKEESKKQSWFSRFMPTNQLKELKNILDLTRKQERKEDRGMQTDDLNEVYVDYTISKKTKKVSFVGEEPEEADDVFPQEKEQEKDSYLNTPKWVIDDEFKSGKIMFMKQQEAKFWESFINKYLKPLDADKEEQKRMAKQLAELRNEVIAGFGFINLIWIAINFMFQLRKPAVITFPTRSDATDVSDSVIKIDALGLMFVIFFVLILLIQFVGMITHRWGTLMHLIAITEISNPCSKNKNFENSSSGGDELKELDAKGILRFCEDVIGEPVPDYPSDEEEEGEDQIEEEFTKTIEQIATIGVKGDIGGTKTTGIGTSLRGTFRPGSTDVSSDLRKTLTDPKFQRQARYRIACSQRNTQVNAKPVGKGNVLRYRKQHPPGSRTDWEAARKFGTTKPIYEDFMSQIEDDTELKFKVKGVVHERTAGNLGYRGTFRANDAPFDYENTNGCAMGMGELDRAFYRKMDEMSKLPMRPSEDYSGLLRYGNNIELNTVEV